MSPAVTRSTGRRGRRTPRSLPVLLLLFLLALPQLLRAGVGVDITPPVPGMFDPEADLRANKPFAFFGHDSIAVFAHEGMIFRVQTEYDSTTGYYVSTRTMFGSEYGQPRVFTPEQYRNYRITRARKKMLQDKFRDAIYKPTENQGHDYLEIQVPFKIKSRTFRKIFGGDRVRLQVSGNITIDGGLRREKSDQILTTQTDQANYNFKIDQTQQFTIVGKVGDKVSVEIDQDSERLFDFENNVKLEYQGYEDEVIQSIEAGNVSLSLPGTQFATMTAKNQGLFGFKTVSKVGPLSVTTIASLQKGQKNKLTYTGGSTEKTIDRYDAEYVRYQYFFVDSTFRDNYPVYTSDYSHLATGRKIEKLEVYRGVRTGDIATQYQGWAVFNAPNMTGATARAIADTIDRYNHDDQLASSRMAISMRFERLTEDEDYTYNPDLGYFRLMRPATATDVIAIAYTLSDNGTTANYGTVNPPEKGVVLKLMKPDSPLPTDETWNLTWKNVYNFETTDLKREDFSLKILRNNTARTENNAEGKSWLEVFGLDHYSMDGSVQPDGKVDGMFLNLKYGEVAFPDLRPFDPQGYDVGGQTVSTVIGDSLPNPDLYDLAPSNQNFDRNFILEATYTNPSTNISLGINVLEGSEEVYLNGTLQTKDKDYIIDYLSGQITLLNPAATAPGANLEINYESGEVFQLDQKTMLGIRLQYDLWEDSFIGGTFLYFNEKPLDKRVKVGSEPLRNIIWDVNTHLGLRPYAMTAMVNALPFIETDAPSELTFEGEIAQVFPNPNSLNNDATGDPNGVAYIDDFEAAKRSTPLGVNRQGWFAASHPLYIPSGDQRSSIYDSWDYRGRMFWYNPVDRTPIKDIWPNREVNTKVPQNTDVLTIEFDPRVNNFRRADVDSVHTWNGIMKNLSSGYYDQTNTRFLEVWMRWTGGGPDAAVYFDMGRISEDVIPDDTLDTEDKPLFAGSPDGNGVLDNGEDTGLDGRVGPDPPWREGTRNSSPPWVVGPDYDYANSPYDWWDLNHDNVQEPNEPFSTDNWAFDYNSKDYDRINGTEGNAKDNEVRVPDTEDLNGNGTLDIANNFFRYRYRLSSQEDSLRYIRGGQENDKGWRLIRIPITDAFDKVKNPDLSQIQYFRIWMTGCKMYTDLQIAQIELVGNEWLEDPVVNAATGDSTVYVTSNTINTVDNHEDYNPPPGVAGEVDPITDLRSKEQSLVIQLQDMPTATEGQIIKNLRSPQDLREYRQLKMFVNGGGRNEQNLAGHDLEMFLRFGLGLTAANRAYYEYSQKLNPGWKGNEIVIDLDQLARLKKKKEEEGGNTAYAVLANGDVLKVVGNPSIGSVSFYSIGIRNLGQPVRKDENLEVWTDELRLSGVRKETGMAMRSALTAKFADFAEVDVNLKQMDATFHQVDQRTGQDKSSMNGNVSVSMQLDKMINPALGIKLPLRGTMQSSLQIPKYTSGNGDIRTSALVPASDLNIWKRFSHMVMNRDYLKDKYLHDAQGNLVIDTTSGHPLQDKKAWGIDTLFTTDQQYAWSLSYSKSRPSNNWLVKYTADKLSTQFNHQQKYSSTLNYQYRKSFNNSGKVSYALSFDQAQVPIFKWTEKIPVLNKLADMRFNYKPTKLNGSVDIKETRTSDKYRNINALERPSYNLNMGRNISTGLRPFNSLNFDYSWSANSQYIREDSTRQWILFNDQPDSMKNRVFYRPGTSPDTILVKTKQQLRQGYGPDGAAIADSVDVLLSKGVSPQDAIRYMYSAIDSVFPGSEFRRPWSIASANDPRYQKHFWNMFGMPFADVQKTQRVGANFTPSLVNWLSTDFSYSSNYNWAWSGFNYTGRGVSTNNTLGANFALKLRQLLPQSGGGGSRYGSTGYNRNNSPGMEGFGATTGRNGQGQGQRDEQEKKSSGAPNLLKLLAGGLRKLQDIRLDYNQNLSFTNPTLQDGTPSLAYRLGMTGDPGLKTIPGQVVYAQSNRTDDYRLHSGVDWSTRINSTLDYTMKYTRATGSRVAGTFNKSTMFLYNSGSRSIKLLDIPNYNLRWTGIEQLGPLKTIADAISFEHSYRGSYTEEWSEEKKADGSRYRLVNSRTYDEAFSPLAGFTIAWKHKISTTIKMNQSTRITENAGNSVRQRVGKKTISLQANYKQSGGFTIPLPIWPFKNRRFKNETNFSLAFDYSQGKTEASQKGSDFKETGNQTSWSVSPQVSYKFSRSVNGSVRYKYGVTKDVSYSSKYQEFGINVNIQIRG